MGRTKRTRPWIGLLLLAAACSSGSLEPKPVPIDRVNCAACGMLVSDLRTACEAVLPGDDPRFYDDIGCVVHDEGLAAKGARVYVPSDVGAGWLAAEAAFYARPADVRTPMGYGVVAFPSRTEARARDRGGRARTWRELVTELRGGIAR